ncbi:2-polyprenyl-3-methyl-5-hydroxy-6-metoxy-1,4-benzoquinol methylase [Pedobacter sp. AK013]|uniref:class I SAM-dependent DNA methyltransferase n=1 Tax=Pedobacter sp. AK013 TaxID=2723071 RepID=UPI001609A2BA|nr:class I SAM-dependent methyltransferase [Pedobacter sp. AK013]MBB6238024.1 2-polyprenyl-3-methyl-5-hydroxy-6-metoxy-1,4-benzoquinol methylase [Pedobacter sp. AK013]
MKILKAAEAFDKSAKIYQEKFMDVSLYNEAFKVFFDNITTNNASVLDIACGPGNITKYLLDNRPDYRILGIDLSSKMLKLAKINNPKAQFQLMDCREIDTIGAKFNGITCGFCLPYLTQQEAINLIANVSKLLKPNGIFYLSTMEEDENNKSRYQISSTGDQVYVNYHKEDYLSTALEENNFETLILKRYSSPDKDGLIITDLVLVCKIK